MRKYCFLFLTFLFLQLSVAFSQPVSVYQYRQVPPDKVAEFLHRETTYWSKVAQKAVDAGTLNQWILLEKVGGYDLPNSSNYLFINTLPDINANMGQIWNAAAVFPDVPMASIETNSISTVTTMAFVRPMEWVEKEGSVPSEHFRFVKFNYWKTTNPNQFVALEAEHWKPFIQKEMMNAGVNQVAWGNAVILSPRGPNLPGNTISFDLYPSIKDALMPSWPEGTVFPAAGLAKLGELQDGRTESLYRVVMAVTNNQ